MTSAATLTEARTNAAAAKAAWETAKIATANAADELEFWNNKVAMLRVTTSRA